MKDDLDILWTGLKVRVKDTFSSTFIIAWLLWNWRSVLYIVYPMSWDLSDRLNFIEGNIYECPAKAWMMLGWGPLVSTLFFLLALPRVTNWIDNVYQEHLVERRKAQAKAQSTLLYTSEEVATLTDLNRTLQQQVDQMSKKIGEQTTQEGLLRENLQKANARAEFYHKYLTEEGKRILSMGGMRF